MSYVDRNLIAGKTVVYETRLHWIVMLGHLLFGVVVLGLPGVALLYYAWNQSGTADPQSVHWMEGGGAALLVGCLIAIVVGSVRRNATEMAVTTRRVVIKTGLAGRRTVELMLNKVESIEVKETAPGRMLGYGTIVVIGTGGTLEPFAKVAHPLKFRSEVQGQIEKLP